jgi:hypothetical protein
VGGPGSGSHCGGSRYLAVEQCYGLDLAQLARRGFLDVPNAKATAPWTWVTTGGDRDGEEATVQVSLDLRTDPATYTIAYAVENGEKRQPFLLTGQLLTTTPRYGGVRYWWACLRCGRRVRVIYAYPCAGRDRFWCRRCHSLRYYSHRESVPDRLLRKSRKLFRRAGSKDGTEPWRKPRWMRWTTFSRLVIAGRDALDTADGVMLYRLGLALDSIKLRHRTGR